jgi:hypothetical protein
LVKATTEGVNRLPSSFIITFGSPPSITATTELVVPKSIPIALPMVLLPPYYFLSIYVSYQKEIRQDLAITLSYPLSHIECKYNH